MMHQTYTSKINHLLDFEFIREHIGLYGLSNFRILRRANRLHVRAKIHLYINKLGNDEEHRCLGVGSVYLQGESLIRLADSFHSFALKIPSIEICFGVE